MGSADSARLARQTVAGAVAVVAGIALAGGVIWSKRPRLEPIEISQQTTYLTTPTRADGWVDYPGAVDWMRRASLDAGGTNAAGPLLVALGKAALETGGDPDGLVSRIGYHRPDGGSETLPALAELRTPSGPAEADRLAPETRAWLGARCPTGDGGAGKGPTLAAAPIDKWLERAGPALAMLREASRAKALYVPVARDAGARDFSRVGPRSEEAARGLRCRAAVRQMEGDPAAGWQDVEAIWNLGALIARSATPGEYTIAASFWKGAMEATVDLAADDRTDDALLAAMQSSLRALPAFPPATETLAILRLQTLHDVAPPLPAGPKPGAPQAGPLAAIGTGARLVELNRQFDALEAALEVADPRQRIARVAQAATGASAAAEAARSVLLPDEIRGRSYQRLASIALALAKRSRETGKLPASLAELRELPADPGSGAPFSYAADGRQFRLVGVGADGRGDGGDPGKDVVAVGVAPPRLAPR